MWDGTEAMRPRLYNWMKAALQALFVAILSGTLVMSAVACPLWMSSASPQTEKHCPDQSSKTQEQCPLSICQASSPYLNSQSGADVPVLTEMPAELVDPSDASLQQATLFQLDHEEPPGRGGPLFLLIHSFLI